MIRQQPYTYLQVEALAAQMAADFKGGEVLALSGDLGAGKTAFTQALARALGVKQTVISPTFAIHRQYATAKPFTLHHFDWYRLSSVGEVEELGVVELLGDPDTVVVVEWPERARQLLPDTTIWMRFEHVDATTRLISFHS